MNKEDMLIAGFRDVYNKMAWLNKNKMEAALKGFKSSEIHCIEHIENNADSNATKLAESFYMTRGAITKLTKKLAEKGIVESYRKPENKKEIYFRLTERGKALFEIHEALHKEFRERDKSVFEQITEEQFDVMLSFVEKYCRHLDAEIEKMYDVEKSDNIKG